MDTITRAYEAAIDIQEGDRAVVAKVNTAAVDRYGTVIEPKGIDLKAYRTNPVVLWEHGQDVRGRVPIGRAAWAKYDKADNALVTKTIFADDQFSDELFRLYQAKVLRAFSVNVIPTDFSKPTSDELRTRPELADAWMVYRKSELGEYSSVSVPGNPEALAMAVSRGLFIPPTIARSLSMPVTRAKRVETDDDEEDVAESAARYIEKEGDKFVVYSEAGKKLGEHDTREDAQAQLDAIEANKKKEGRTLELPPLVGRTFAQVLDETLLSVRAEVRRAIEDQKAETDLRRGVV